MSTNIEIKNIENKNTETKNTGNTNIENKNIENKNIENKNIENNNIAKKTPKKTSKKTSKKAVKKTAKKATKKVAKKATNRKYKNKSKNGVENKTRISLINCSKSIKISLPDYSSVGATYSVSMELGKEDYGLEKVNERRVELSNLVEQYLAEEVNKVLEFYRNKRKELETEILEYSKKLSELSNLKAQHQFLSRQNAAEIKEEISE